MALLFFSFYPYFYLAPCAPSPSLFCRYTWPAAEGRHFKDTGFSFCCKQNINISDAHTLTPPSLTHNNAQHTWRHTQALRVADSIRADIKGAYVCHTAPWRWLNDHHTSGWIEIDAWESHSGGKERVQLVNTKHCTPHPPLFLLQSTFLCLNNMFCMC